MKGILFPLVVTGLTLGGLAYARSQKPPVDKKIEDVAKKLERTGTPPDLSSPPTETPAGELVAVDLVAKTRDRVDVLLKAVQAGRGLSREEATDLIAMGKLLTSWGYIVDGDFATNFGYAALARSFF